MHLDPYPFQIGKAFYSC